LNVVEFFSFQNDGDISKSAQFLAQQSIKDELSPDLKIILNKVISNHQKVFHKSLKEFLNSLYIRKEFLQIHEILSKHNDLSIELEKIHLKTLYNLGRIKDFEVLAYRLLDRIREKKLWCNLNTLTEDLRHLETSKSFIELKLLCLEAINDEKSLVKYIVEIIQKIIENPKKFDTDLSELANFVTRNFGNTKSTKQIKSLLNYLMKEQEQKIETLELIINFHEHPYIISTIKNKSFGNENDLKVKITTDSQEQESHFIFEESQSAPNYEELENNDGYQETEFESILRTRLRLKDPQFDLLRKDMIISFLDLNMYKLAVEYIDSFEVSAETLYLKLEALLKLGKFSKVIEEVNLGKSIHNDGVAFLYLKARALESKGEQVEAIAVFKEVFLKDPEFRKAKEKISES